MRFRFNLAEPDENAINRDIFVVVKDRDDASIKAGLKKAGLIHKNEQVKTIRAQDFLPNYWPDRFFIDYTPGDSGDIVKALLVRVRED
jgi:hypothetical protein